MIEIQKQNTDQTYCKPCDQFFSNNHCFKKHVKIYHSKTCPGKHPCPHCTKKYTTSNILKKHIELFHKRKPKKYICDHCDKEFTHRKLIILHLRKHMPERNKVTNVCDICGKVLRVGKSGMREHKNSHLGIRPYSCQYCGDTFTYSGARYTHIKLKHKKHKKIYTTQPSATTETDDGEDNKSEKDDASESVSSSLKHKKQDNTTRNTSATKKTDNKEGKHTEKDDDSEIVSAPKAKRKGKTRNKTRKGRNNKKRCLEDVSDSGLLDEKELMTVLS